MNKTILSIAAISALAVSSFAASDLAGAFKEGKATGQIRAAYVKVDNKDSSIADQSGFAIGGKLDYQTASLYGISAGATFYTSQDLGTKSDTAAKVLPDMLDQSGKSYSVLGQSYLVGQYGKTTVKVGRQQLDTPLAGSDDIRMIPNLFEAAVVINTDLPNTTLIGAHVTRMMGGGTDSASNRNAKTAFSSMSRSALGATVDAGNIGDTGVNVAAVIYAGIKDLSLQAWYYNAIDVLNAPYLQADYSLAVAKDTKLNLSAQYYSETGIGKTKAALGSSKVDYSVWGAKAALALEGLGLTPSISYNKVADKDSVTTFGAWGGYPEFSAMEEWTTNSGPAMNGAALLKVGVDYSLEKLGLGNRTLTVAYGNYDYKTKYNANSDKDAKIIDVALVCDGALVKNLAAKIAYESVDSKDDTLDRKYFKVVMNYSF